MHNFIITYCGEDGPTETDVKDVKLINIEEGPRGEDIMTWNCNLCEKDHKSTVYRKR